MLFCFRNLVKTHRDALVKQFDEEENPANAFHLGIMLLYVTKMNQVLHVPGKMIMDVLLELSSKIDTKEYLELKSFGEKVKEFLTAQIKKQKSAEQLGTEVTELLPTFKTCIKKLTS